jgi:condensin complex subunit 3
LSKQLKISCSSLLSSRDSCSATKQAASKLICAGWMKAFKYNPLALLKHMDVSAHEQSCEKALLVIFEAADQASNSPLLSGLSRSERQAFSAGVFNAIISIQSDDHTDDDMSETPFTLLDGEAVFFSRVACQRALETKTLSSVKKAQVVAQVVPDITVLCQVLQSHLMWITSQHSITAEQGTDEVATFVCSQLLQLAKMSDLQEEGSRRHFSTFMRQVLGSMDTPYDLIEGCLKAWKDASEHEADFLHDVSAILETLSGHNQVNGETDEEFDCLLRILLILSVVLETRSSTTPDFAGIGFEKYIVPAVTHANNSVREAGVSCFGKLGLYTDQESRLAEFKPLLLRVASRQEEKLEVRAQALLALCDWVLIFPDMLTPCNIDGSEVSLMSIVTGLLHHARSGGVAVAAEVAVKLLFSGKFCDSETIAELMILFFDELPKTSSPHDDDDDINQVGSPERLQQLLSVFFPAYATTSPTGRDALLGSIGPLLIKANIRQAKSNQNAKATNVVNMVNYICSTVGQVMAQENVTAENTTLICLADTGEDAPEVTKSPPAAPGVHMSASIQISQFLVNAGEDVRTTMLRSLCKLLGSMSMSIATSEDHQALLLLKNCNEELGMIITDPTSLRSLTALNEALADVAIDDEADNAGGARNEIVDEETEDDDDDDNDVAGEETEEEENASLSDDIPDDASGETLVNGMRSVFISSNANKENPVSSSVAFKHEKPNKERAPRACRAQGNCQGSK